MNGKFSFLLLIMLMVSCKSKEDSKQIFSQKNKDFSISISTINTKINAGGIAQCSKYAKTTITDTNYTCYGLKLNEVLAMALRTNSKYVGQLPFDSLNSKYLDIQIDNLTKNKLNYDSILAISISYAFNLNVFAIDTVLTGYKLFTLDNDKLKQYQSSCKNGIIRYQDGIWTAKASSLLGLTKIIDQYSKSYISFEVPNQNCYSFEFVTGDDFDKINAKLKSMGLQLIKTQIEQTFYNVKRLPTTPVSIKSSRDTPSSNP